MTSFSRWMIGMRNFCGYSPIVVYILTVMEKMGIILLYMHKSVERE